MAKWMLHNRVATTICRAHNFWRFCASMFLICFFSCCFVLKFLVILSLDPRCSYKIVLTKQKSVELKYWAPLSLWSGEGLSSNEI